MSNKISFYIPGVVAPFVRMTGREARHSHWGRGSKDAAIQRYFAYKDAFKLQAGKYARLLVGPLRLSCEFIMPRPKARAKEHYHIVRPDLTNLVKTVEDAMNDLCYKDDSQIAAYGETLKRYAYAGEEPGVLVTVEQLDIIEERRRKHQRLDGGE